MRYLIIVVAVLAAVNVSWAAEPHEHTGLEIGVRSSYFDLLDSKRKDGDHFLGSIDEFVEDENYMPLPFVNVRFGTRWALQLGYDQFRAKTWSVPDPGDDFIPYSDGTVDVSGPSISMQYYFPASPHYTLFAEAGALIYSAYFDHRSAWRNARGDKNSHILDIADQNGYRVGLGCDIHLSEDWSLVLTAHRTFMEVGVSYYLYGEKIKEVTFPLDHNNFALGIKYSL